MSEGDFGCICSCWLKWFESMITGWMFTCPRFICCVFIVSGLAALFWIDVRWYWVRSIIGGPVRFGVFKVDEVPVMPPKPLPGFYMIPYAPVAAPFALPWNES